MTNPLCALRANSSAVILRPRGMQSGGCCRVVGQPLVVGSLSVHLSFALARPAIRLLVSLAEYQLLKQRRSNALGAKVMANSILPLSKLVMVTRRLCRTQASGPQITTCHLQSRDIRWDLWRLQPRAQTRWVQRIAILLSRAVPQGAGIHIFIYAQRTYAIAHVMRICNSK